MTTNAPPAVQVPTSRSRQLLAASVGNAVEWFDWYVYSAFTLYFVGHFFPKNDPTAQLLSAAAVFAIGFVMRPIGAWIMGIYADRKGRKAALTLALCGADWEPVFVDFFNGAARTPEYRAINEMAAYVHPTL